MENLNERPELEFDAGKFVEELREKGLKDEEILTALEEAFKTGELTEEEYFEVKKYLEGEEKKVASNLFGVEI